ncbi:MAG TPA: PIG-L family deacetylase [Acidobacteriaceae bacterium]|jgi:LmbE family N-acetylglucosaminyl deacetylase|nr:PIG-L family deacetylase [Acidobacteriaceae bacterium]
MTIRPATARLLALALTFPLAGQAQFTPQNDPANLSGEQVSAPALADTLPINHGAPALQQLLRKLRTRASFMLIVAHPDDEDNGMLTYLSRGKGARVATLTLNRGEGGQNLMSADFGDALGLIRTQELLLSDRYMGVDQFFGTEVDFGFSKTKEEAFAKWTHERVLYDAVRAIRLYRPLVIASVFIGEPSDGHGQHQVSGEIAQEAFKAAGDPNVFPDQIAAGLLPWQPLKVYARAPFGRIDEKGMYDYATTQYVPARFENYVTGKVTSTVPKANVIVPEGDTDPLLGGLSYAQFGREGRSLQRSQIGGGGGGRGGPGGRADVSYHRYGSMLNQPDGEDSGRESSFFDGIDISFAGMATLVPEAAEKFHPPLEKIDSIIAKAQHDFDPAKPYAIAPTLHDALAALDEFIHELENPAINDFPPNESFNLLHELRIKRVQLNDALVLAHGVTMKAAIDDGPPGQNLLTTQTSLRVNVTLDADSSLHVDYVSLDAPNGLTAKANVSGNSAHFELATPHGLPATRPYFSRPGIEQAVYDVAVPALRNAPATPDPLAVTATVSDDGVPITVRATVAKAQKSGPALPAIVVPPVSVSVGSSIGIVTPKDRSFNVTAQLRSNAGSAASGSVILLLPDHKPADGGPQKFSFQKLDQEAHFAFAVPATAIPGHPVFLSTTATEDHHTYAEGFRAVGYPGLTPTNYYTPGTYKAVPVDVHTAPTLDVAYLPGTGDDVPAGLDQLGIHAHLITVADIASGKLSQYDAIILGVRAYAAHPELAGKGSQPLIDYARNGGVVIAQYNNARYGSAEAPFPITVANSSGDHAHDVVDETAPVTILAADSPLLTWPNRITAADFNGWVEERGHSFAATWAPEYQPLLETHDPGQQPQQGGLLTAHVGKGFYIYLGLAVYRQLPEGVPGAYRLLANLISTGKNPALVAAK